MALTFYDPRLGAPREFRPAAPPDVGVESGPGPRTAREAALARALADALAFLGLRPVEGREIRVGGPAPGSGAAWLQAAPVDGESPAPSDDDFRYLCLKTHYRRPLFVSREALAGARAERVELLAAAREAGGAAHAAALAGYLHRFKGELARDLDLPGALACVRDGLRPGALSPGSRAALVRETFPALGLAPWGPGSGH